MARWLIAAFLLVPVVEIAVIIQVGQLIGVLPTVVLLVVESLLGAWLVKREGGRAWDSLRGTVVAGQMPDVALLDAALVVVGGTLLLTPGFVTDIAGFACVLPFTRPLMRRVVVAALVRRGTRTRLVSNRRIDEP
jgi:UPF0716 protein FxsA